MIPHTISDRSLTFFAGRFYTVGDEHPHFSTILERLRSGVSEGAELARLADVRVAVSDATDGRVEITEDEIIVEGQSMGEAWHAKAMTDPESTRVLLVKAGDRVRVEGDEDAPDGVYTVGDVDNADVEKRVYVESDEDYFGFVANTSIKEIVS